MPCPSLYTITVYTGLPLPCHNCNSTDIETVFSPEGERVGLKPMMKLIANMHGNEAVGREMMLALSAYLLENFDTDQRVRDIVSRTDIHIMPSLNPDGKL